MRFRRALSTFGVAGLICAGSVGVASTSQAATLCVIGPGVTQTATTVTGSSGNDTIDCTNATQGKEIFGNAGNDTITGSAFKDTVRGGAGNDTMTGGAGGDTMFGWLGDDTITGSAGYDSCTGGDGTDTIISCETVKP